MLERCIINKIHRHRYSPSAQCRIPDLDDDVGRVDNFREWPFLNSDVELPMEDDGFHGAFSHDHEVYNLSDAAGGKDEEKVNFSKYEKLKV